MAKKIINIVLFLIVVVLCVVLYQVIQRPIKFEEGYTVRNQQVIQRLKDVRSAQKIYLRAHGKYAGDLGELVRAVQEDSVRTIKTIGDPNDTSVVTTYDTIQEAIKDIIVFEEAGLEIAKLREIPNSGGKDFTLRAGVKELQRVNIPVFEVVAPKELYLAGLDAKYIKYKEDRKVGSMDEGSDAGNWE